MVQSSRSDTVMHIIMSGFFSRRFDPAMDLPDLKGKVIIVTGGKCVFSLLIVPFN